MSCWGTSGCTNKICQSRLAELRPFRFCPRLRFVLWLGSRTKNQNQSAEPCSSPRNDPRRVNDRRSRGAESCAGSPAGKSPAGKSPAGNIGKIQENQLVVARCYGHQPGRCGRHGIPWVLARQDGLAGQCAGIFLPGLSELWRDAVIRREHFQRAWPVSLRFERTHRLAKIHGGKSWSRGRCTARGVVVQLEV